VITNVSVAKKIQSIFESDWAESADKAGKSDKEAKPAKDVSPAA
jgi:hypothetical protein